MFDLIKRKPTLSLTPLNEVDKLFDDFFNNSLLSGAMFNVPSVNVYSEGDHTMVVELEVPGYDQDDIEISVDNNALEVRGKRTEKEEHKDKKRSYMVRENSQSFARRIVLPEGADTNNISADLDKGVLKVTVPVERTEARRIEIGSSKSSPKTKLAATTTNKEKSE